MAAPFWTSGPSLGQVTPEHLHADNGGASDNDGKAATEWAVRFSKGGVVVRDWLRYRTAPGPDPGTKVNIAFGIPPADQGAFEYVRPPGDAAGRYTVEVLPGSWTDYTFGEQTQGYVLEWAKIGGTPVPDIRSAYVDVAALAAPEPPPPPPPPPPAWTLATIEAAMRALGYQYVEQLRRQGKTEKQIFDTLFYQRLRTLDPSLPQTERARLKSAIREELAQ